MTLRECLLDCVDDILSIRDDIGVALKSVAFVTRTWDGATVGEGNAVDVREPLIPTPGLREYQHDLRLTTGGEIQSGDILIRGISGNLYDHAAVSRLSVQENVERFYEIGMDIYKVISVTEQLLTWNVLVRKISDQRRYG